MDLSALILAACFGASVVPFAPPTSQPTTRPSLAALAAPGLSSPQSAWLETKVALDTGDWRRFAQVTRLTDDVHAWAMSMAGLADAGRDLRSTLTSTFGLDAQKVMGGIPGGGGVTLRALRAKEARELISKMTFTINGDRATTFSPGATNPTHLHHDKTGWHAEYVVPREKQSAMYSETALNNELAIAVGSLAYDVRCGTIRSLQQFQSERGRQWREAYQRAGSGRTDYPATTQPSTQPATK